MLSVASRTNATTTTRKGHVIRNSRLLAEPRADVSGVSGIRFPTASNDALSAATARSAFPIAGPGGVAPVANTRLRAQDGDPIARLVGCMISKNSEHRLPGWQLPPLRSDPLAPPRRVAGATARLRARLAVVEQHPAQEPRRPCADRLGLRAARAAHARAARRRARCWAKQGSRRSSTPIATPITSAATRRSCASTTVTIAVPAAEAPLVERWDGKALLYDYCDHRIERFVADRVIPANSTHVWGDLEWTALAAPGHDMGALVFYNAEHRILISGDALWEHGFGFVMPPEIDPDAMPATRATIEMLGTLDIRVVIPGHGEPFTDVAGALERARKRHRRLRRGQPAHRAPRAQGQPDVRAARQAADAACRPARLRRARRHLPRIQCRCSSACRLRASPSS